MNFRIGPLYMQRGSQTLLLATVVGSVLGCWVLSRAMGEDHVSNGQSFITLWSSETASSLPSQPVPAPTAPLQPIHVAALPNVTQVKPLPMHRLPAIDPQQNAYSNALIVENPYAASQGATAIVGDASEKQSAAAEQAAPSVQLQPAPQAIPPQTPVPTTRHLPKPTKTIVRIPPARELRAPSVEVVDNLPYASAPLPPSMRVDVTEVSSAPPRSHDEPREKLETAADVFDAEVEQTETEEIKTQAEVETESGDRHQGTQSETKNNDEVLEPSTKVSLPAIEHIQNPLPDIEYDYDEIGDAEFGEAETLGPDWTLSPAMPNTPTVAEISVRVMPAVQKGYGLARRGALYAARSEFVAILRRIAAAKDAELGTNEHTRSLARGLRALDEADDFVPAGAQLEDEFNVLSVAKSHRTPVLRNCKTSIMPHDAIAHYHAYAAEEIGLAVAGEQAGSMVLYGLGKIHNRIALNNDQDIQSVRKSMSMYQASLLSHPRNHLAANELGVLLAQAGHHQDAMAQFEMVVQLSPGSVAYRNLAAVQRKLGMSRYAHSNEQASQQLARMERSTGAVSRSLGVEWVAANEMARVSQPSQMPAARPNEMVARNVPFQTQLAQPPASGLSEGNRKGPLGRFVAAAKSVTRSNTATSQPQVRTAQPQIPTPAVRPKNTFWR